MPIVLVLNGSIRHHVQRHLTNSQSPLSEGNTNVLIKEEISELGTFVVSIQIQNGVHTVSNM